MFQRIESEDRGATMTEYGIVLALIAGVAMAVVALVGTDVFALFSQLPGRF